MVRDSILKCSNGTNLLSCFKFRVILYNASFSSLVKVEEMKAYFTFSHMDILFFECIFEIFLFERPQSVVDYNIVHELLLTGVFENLTFTLSFTTFNIQVPQVMFSKIRNSF